MMGTLTDRDTHTHMEESSSTRRHEPGSVDLQHSGITDIDALQLLPNLETLSLHNNAIGAVEGLQSLTRLTSLYIGCNLVKDARPLSSLVHLEVLDLSENRLQAFCISSLERLRVLNLAGNRLQSEDGLAGLQSLPSLTALSLARNEISSKHALVALQNLPLQLLVVIGNPFTTLQSRRIEDFASRWPSLRVLDAEAVPGKRAEAEGLLASLPAAANLGNRLRSEGDTKPQAAISQAGPSRNQTAHPSNAQADHARAASVSGPFSAVTVAAMAEIYAAQGAAEPAAQDEPDEGSSERPPLAQLRLHDSAQEGQGADLVRRASVQILDSADDMTEGGQSHASSTSQFGDEAAAAPEVASPFLPGLVERQDSANYQPRPPALAERQDSAQNLQALAEAEAELAAVGHVEQPLSRQDSAHELDDAARSPSPPVASRSLSIGRRQSLRNSLAESSSRTGQAVLDLSPRHDSATERPLGRQRSVDGNARSTSRQPMFRRPQDAHSLPENVALVPLEGQEVLAHRRGDSASDPLATARQLVQGDAPLRTSRTGAEDFSVSEVAPRQDSALDSLAEARLAVLGDLPHLASNPLPTSDPLVRARMLVQSQSLGSPSSSHPILLETGSVPHPSHLQASLRGSLLQGRRSLPDPESPFDRALTPLSPRWTLSHLTSGTQSYSQTLPRISSGVPWTPPGSRSSATPGPEDPMRAGSGGVAAGLGGSSSSEDLLAEARRVVLGNIAEQKSENPPNPFADAGVPSPFGQPPPWATESALRPVSTSAHGGTLPGRDSAAIRETPYPDSPLAAGEEGSRQDPTFFQRQASLRMVGSQDMAESSAAAAARVCASGDSAIEQ